MKSFPHYLSLAFLLLAALPMNGLDQAEPAPREPIAADTQGVVLFAPLSPALAFANAEALARLDLDRATAVWLWREGLPPLRRTPQQLTQHEPPAKTSWVAVQLYSQHQPRHQPSPPKEPPQRWLLAAPERMWREVPEALLPRFAVDSRGHCRIPVDPHHEGWRVRLVGDAVGSWWTELRQGVSTLNVLEYKAEDREIQVLSPEGNPLAGSQAEFLVALSRRSQRLKTLARVSAGESGRLMVETLPGERPVLLTVREADHAPQLLDSPTGALPKEIRLTLGAHLRGVLRDADRRPLSDLEISAEAWLSPQAAFPLYWRTQSDATGSWDFAGLPRGEVLLRIAGEGLVPFSSRFDLSQGDLDLGEVLLEVGARLRVMAVSDLGLPISGAKVSADVGITALTDAKGTALLAGLPAGKSLRLSGSAEGHIGNTVKLGTAWPTVAILPLMRGVTVTGTLLREDGQPPLDATALLAVGNRSNDVDLAPSGDLSFTFPPERAARLTLRSPSTLPVEIQLEAGSPGDRIDLGILLAPVGLTLRGRLLAEADSSPVAGARLWSLRATTQGPLIAWMRGDTVETRSLADGGFEMSGLTPGSTSVRVEAAGFAPRFLRVASDPEGPLESIDLGEIYLSLGATLTLLAPAEENLTAYLDLVGEGMPMDTLSRAIEKGEAHFDHLPPGLATLSVLRGESILCREEVPIGEDGDVIEVECNPKQVSVEGVVLVGDRPTGPATLVWTTPGPDLPEGILNLISPGGLRQQKTFMALRSEIVVEVDAEGSFRTDSLTPGSWQVTRHLPGSVESSPNQQVTISAEVSQRVLLRYAEHFVEGTVLDESGLPSVAARVRDLTNGSLAFTDREGRFRFSGLDVGVHIFQAKSGELTSEAVSTELEDRRRGESLILHLAESQVDFLAIQVLQPDENPAAGALLFLDTGTNRLSILSADLHGRARFEHLTPIPRQVRIAAHHSGRWTLGGWIPWREVTEDGMNLALGEAAGTLRLVTREGHGTVRIRDASGWDLTKLLTWLGSQPRVAPNTALLLTGLPPGHYRISLADGANSDTEVLPNETVEIELEAR